MVPDPSKVETLFRLQPRQRGIWIIFIREDSEWRRKPLSIWPGDLRFPNFSDVTPKLCKHVRDHFPSGHPLLDSRVTNQVAPEAEF